MTYKPLSSRGEIREAFETFRECMYQAGKPIKKKLGWQGGGAGAVDVLWNSDTKVWAFFDPEFAENRYWCAFGVSEELKEDSLSIACEINFPYEGTNRRVAGAFFSDGENVFVGHSGKVGGGMKGVGKHAFRKYCEDVDIALIAYPRNKKVDLIKIGSLDDPDLPEHVAQFVKKAAGFKQHIRQSQPERKKGGRTVIAVSIDNDTPTTESSNGTKPTVSKNWSNGYKTRGKPLKKKDVEDREIQAYPRSIRDLLQNKQYTIDFYQREYKWETRHVEELLDDLESRFAENYRTDDERTSVQYYEQYFLGSIILSKKEGQQFIVDGQQRLTTLTLLLIYLNNIQKDDNSRIDLQPLIYSTVYGRRSFNLDIDERTEIMEALLKGNSFDTKDGPESVQNVWDRYSNIKEYYDDTPKGDELPFFIDWLLEKVVLVEITAHSDEDAYTIFETMNDRGLSLSPTDMLKGYLIAKIAEDDAKQKSLGTWKSVIHRLKKEGDDQDSDFFKAWFRAQHAETIRERKKGASPGDFDHIGTKYHRWIRDNSDELGLMKSQNFEEFVNRNMDFYARQYGRIRMATQVFDKDLACIYYNDSLHFTLQYPVLLAPLTVDDDTGTVILKLKVVSRALDIMLARRAWNWSRITYNAMYFSMFSLVRLIRNRSVDELVTILSDYLDDQEEDFSNSAFRLTQQNRTAVHFFLARITDYIQIQSGYPIDFENLMNYGEGTPYEVEHIWAYKYERHTDEFDQKSDFEEYRNRIGGLLLLPKGFNQSYGADPYEAKIERYLRNNLLAQSLHEKCYEKNPDFLTFTRDSELPFMPHTQFKKADMDQRQALYQEICERIWDPAILAQDADRSS